MHRVELLQYSAFLENICKVFYEGQISRDATLTMLQLKFDRMLYEAMMSRNMNFRPSDLSSAFRDTKYLTYIKRLFSKGDECIPNEVLLRRPILNCHPWINRICRYFIFIEYEKFNNN